MSIFFKYGLLQEKEIIPSPHAQSKSQMWAFKKKKKNLSVPVRCVKAI